MVKITPEIYDDPCMQVGSWVYIDCRHLPEPKIISSFDNYLSQARKVLLRHRLKMIMIAFDPDLQTLPGLLSQNGFSPILKTWRLKIKTLSQPLNSSLSLKTPTFSAISPLLAEQADYHHQLYPNYYKSWSDINLADYEKYITAETAKKNSITLTYLKDRKPIGFLWGGISRSCHSFIWELIVDQDHRHHGIGQALVNNFIQICQNRHVDTIEAETGYNQPAGNFYQKLGFRPAAQNWYQIV